MCCPCGTRAPDPGCITPRHVRVHLHREQQRLHGEQQRLHQVLLAEDALLHHHVTFHVLEVFVVSSMDVLGWCGSSSARLTPEYSTTELCRAGHCDTPAEESAVTRNDQIDVDRYIHGVAIVGMRCSSSEVGAVHFQ